MPVRRPRLAIALVALAGLGACGRTEARPEIAVAAASSLREAMPSLTRAYEAAHPGRRVTASFAASGDLRKQVEAGAPVDVVLFASGRPVDELIAEGRAVRESRRVLATNELVLVGRKGTPFTFASLTKLPEGEKIAVGDPRTVPVGEYARDYLSTLGEWDALQGRVVFGASVAAVLAYARRGEVAVGIVYRTELHGVDDLVVLDEAKGERAPRPLVVGAIVKGGSVGASEFLSFVASREGESLLHSFGFGAP